MGNRNVTERVKHICHYKFRVHSGREGLFFCHLIKASILITSRPTLDGATLSILKQRNRVEIRCHITGGGTEQRSSRAGSVWRGSWQGLIALDEAAERPTTPLDRYLWPHLDVQKPTCLFIITKNDTECDETASQASKLALFFSSGVHTEEYNTSSKVLNF